MNYIWIACLLSTAVAATDDSQIHVVDAKGHAVSRAQVYEVVGVLEGVSIDSLGPTNSRGVRVDTIGITDLFIATKNGKAAISAGTNRLRFGKSGTLKIRVSDDHGSPIPNQFLTLFPTSSKPPLLSYGALDVLLGIPDELKKYLTASTDKNGIALFPSLPIDGRFDVITDGGGPESLHFEGAAMVGHDNRLVIAKDRIVEGSVYEGPSMKPVSGVMVKVMYLPHSGQLAPERTIRSTVSDASGHYKITGLPNYEFGLEASPPGPSMISGRQGTDPWTFLGCWQELPPLTQVFYDLERMLNYQPATQTTHVDFRLDQTVRINVKVRNPHHVSEAGLFFGCRQVPVAGASQTPGGFQVHQAPFSVLVGSGKFLIFAYSRHGNEKVLTTVDTIGKTSIDVTCDLPADL